MYVELGTKHNHLLVGLIKSVEQIKIKEMHDGRGDSSDKDRYIRLIWKVCTGVISAISTHGVNVNSCLPERVVDAEITALNATIAFAD